MAENGTAAVTIAVEMCGMLADLCGRHVPLSIPAEGCTASILLARAAEIDPALSQMVAEGRVRVCVNDTLVFGGTTVSPRDRVALFPPVSGG